MNPFLSTVNDASSIAITGHIHPDGDCVGSCLGLRRFILDHDPSKNVDVYLEPIAPEFHFLDGADSIYSQLIPGKSYDLLVILDCSTIDRIKPFDDLLNHTKTTFCIDHHFSNQGLCDSCVVNPNASATCEVLFDLFEKNEISLSCAYCLYLGIVHDTGVFKHSNTTGHTMEVAGRLIEKGINTSQVIDETFYQKTYVQNVALGQALLNTRMFFEHRIILAYLTQNEMDQLQVSPADVNGIIDQLRVTKGVEAAVFTYPLDEYRSKVSMRSNGDVNVASIAEEFNGGGHIKAAGFDMDGDYHQVIEQVIPKIGDQIK